MANLTETQPARFQRASSFPCAALLLAAFGLGLFFEGYQDLHYAPASLALLLCALLAIIPAFWRGLEIPSAPVPILLFALWLYVTLSLSWSSVPYASLVTYLIFIACPLGFFTLLLAPGRKDLTKAAVLALWTGLAVIAVWAVIQHALYGGRAHHPLPSPNNLAALINLGLLPALALLLWIREKGWRLYAALALYGLFFAALVATESRGGLLGFIIAAGILVFLMRGRPPVLWMRLLLVVAISAALFSLSGMTGDLRFAARMGDLLNPAADASALARLVIWQNTWEMVKDHLWLGTGFGTFYLYYPHYRRPGMEDNSLGHWAHMDPLQYWAEMGVIAPVLFYGLCLAVLLGTIRALKATPGDTPRRAVIAASFCALLAVILHTHADFHLYIMPVLVVIGVWLAAWYQAAMPDALRPVAIEKWQKPFMSFITLAITGLIGAMALSSAAGQYHLLRAHDLIRQGMTEQFVAAIEKAERWAPRSFIDPEVQLAALYIDLLGKNADALFTPAEQQALYQQTRDLLAIAGSQNPPWGEIDYKRGQLYEAIDTGYEPEARLMAVSAYEQAVKKDPVSFRARIALARLYASQGRIESAYEVLKTGLTYPHPPAIGNTYREMLFRLEGLVALKRGYQEQRQENP